MEKLKLYDEGLWYGEIAAGIAYYATIEKFYTSKDPLGLGVNDNYINHIPDYILDYYRPILKEEVFQ